MKLKRTASLIAIFIFASGVLRAQPNTSDSIKRSSPVVADGAMLQLISDDFSFTEGPAADKNGNIYFTDQPNNRIWKYSTSGKLSVFLDSAGRSNGMYFDRHGNLVTCADEHNQLWSISPKKEVTILLKDLDGLHFNGPNDLWIDGKNNIYFTDPYYQRDYWTRKAPEMAAQHVYYFQQGKPPVVAADSMIRPNGIIGTADGKYLYVADIGAGKTYRFNIGTDGKLTNKTLFADKGSDGMTIDNKGNIYLTGKGVSVFDPQGKQIDQIDVPANWTANVTFGGRKRDMLFITASKAVYMLKMKVKAGK
ncbi:SMP-30/gluconolactonase/LRE family protein [Ferruginibacter sp. HRS2-29]|uniref:SMP-30/gluconolactonase/LRE family protein n=1 Tax=Ferruginibacter sp. HRS2-29 TaxID=2487334 RepID=UPI0020CC5CB0|nr:SMP-30/gluconolactonase/LRE family protein [Ferruginibacter sp. HRS2-29]MCP9751228.1 SMP-30/gluconolactonase/LRE family protein [Ferruginibacter sp. HRS2-29]